MYWKEILWLFSWPTIIWANYLLVSFVLKKYEQKYPSDAKSDG
jgi:hypothetical protein